MQQFTNLKVWHRSHQLALNVYRLSARFPPAERFGIASQIRRAATSVPTNIAEGSKRLTQRDFERFLNIAEGSLAELQYLLMLCRDLGFAEAAAIEPLQVEAGEVARMLHGLRLRVSRSAGAQLSAFSFEL